MDNYGEHPKSIGEIKADKSQNAADWTPRDALIDLLRSIDSGEVKPDALVIGWRDKLPSGATQTRYSIASPDYHTAMGVIEAVKFRLHGDN